MKYNINRGLNQRIKKIRVQRNETLEEFAEQIRKKTDFKIKTTKSNVSKWEKGLNVPNDITLNAISKLGDITVDELLYGSEEERIQNSYSILSLANKNGVTVGDPLNGKLHTKESLIQEATLSYSQLTNHYEKLYKRLNHNELPPSSEQLANLETIQSIIAITNEAIAKLDELKEQ